MRSRWTDAGAKEAIKHWGSTHGESMAVRLYSARLIGADPDLVLHGGGNVSLKSTHRGALGHEVDSIHVKASGFDLDSIEPAAMVAMDLAHLKRFRKAKDLTDDAMVNEFRRALFDTSSATPSIETLVHAFLPHRFIDHSHADAVLAVTNHGNGESLARGAMGDCVGVLPYVRPGFDLAKAVADLYDMDPTIDAIVLLQHGLLTFADDARTAYERHIQLVDACERYLRDDRKPRSRSMVVTNQSAAPEALATSIAPTLRGLLAVSTDSEDQPFRPFVLEWRHSDEILAVLNQEDAKDIANSGPLTGDHLIRTKPWPLFVDRLSWEDSDAVRSSLGKAIESYEHGYRAYVKANGGAPDAMDALPRVVLIRGAGLFAWGSTKLDARIAADIAEHTLLTVHRSLALGPYQSLTQEHLFDMEFRGLQRVKLRSEQGRPLERQVVVISGAAGAIGAAIADVCATAGAHVALTDLDPQRLEQVVRRLVDRHGDGTAVGFAMDVTSEASVRAGFESIIREYGGADVIVPNAGIAHVASIDELAVEDFRRVMEVNAVGYLLFMQQGIKILKQQRLGGHIVINASKNVFGPGKDFGAYSASKAAGHQLGKVAAIELAQHGIRVNMINADAVFGDEQTPSGLWKTVGPQRAKSRNMKEADLPEYYRGRNLLKARVLGHHVGNAVVFFASGATPTTGATLPVDGGVVEAFPR